MDIRPLHPTRDFAILRGLFDAAADYVELESGAPPSDQTVTDFLQDRPPNTGPEAAHHFGLFDGADLVGAMGMLFGYPDPSDAYIGLLILDPAHRGGGMGAQAVHHAADFARHHSATRLLVAVLEENPKGRAFWDRQGFTLEKTFPAGAGGHIRHRLTRAL